MLLAPPADKLTPDAAIAIMHAASSRSFEMLVGSEASMPTKAIVATTPAPSTPPRSTRAILREEVAFPEHVEIEFERVMQVVFAVR